MNVPENDLTVADRVVPEPIAEPQNRDVIETIAVILLGLAALLTAYAAYYGSLAGGDALQGYSKSTIDRNEANSYYSDYGQKVAADQNVFLQYQIKVEEGDTAVAEVIRQTLFSPELETAYVAWQQLEGENDVPSPLDTPEYVVEELGLYQENFALATQEFDDAQQIDDQGDNMDLASVFLAVSLFAAGVAGVFKVRTVSYVLLVGSAVLLAPGIWAIGKGKAWW